jgi:hypothetical protein
MLAQQFEGTIEFKKVKAGKESSYLYYVQRDFVRLEEYGPSRTIVDIAVINLKEEKVYLLSPERKSYMILRTNESTKDMSHTKVEMTKETKTILGYPCNKWVINNTDLNAQVTYWVTAGNYDFFVALLAALKRKDYHALFYQQVPAAIGYFPMVSIWTDMAGVEKERLEVIKIDPHILRGNFFSIPADYTEIKN